MATPAQLTANRLNSLKSTGPSAAGLAVTRFNALKSGLDAKSLVIPGEDPAELAALAENYRVQFQPASPLEIALLDTLVTAEWELRRLRKIQPKLWNEDAFLDPESKEAKRLTRFYRRLDTAERSYHRALKELNRYGAARAREAAAGLPAPQKPSPQPRPAPAKPAPEEKLASFLNNFDNGFLPADLSPAPFAVTGLDRPANRLRK
ncbi:MAG TPA: hypothetical protein VKV17_13050 [Bryobacteraceae bacterium]|nr:hypothetical protein [Bryobacteraceae bacterium]